MHSFKFGKIVAIKVALAAVLLAFLAGIAGSQLAPNLPLYSVLLYSAVGAVVLFFTLVIATIATLTFAQFILRKGGTDVQWLWFSADPQGLVQLRAQARAQARDERVQANR